MPLVLNIETAVTTSSVCIAENGVALGVKVNPSQKDSAAWLHVAIRGLLHETGVALKDLAAVAVSAGPGSYTGLRVGLSAAKGLCFALDCPLILLGTLQIMTVAASGEKADLYCPMIDARRMEVFTAVYDKGGKTVVAPHNLVLTDDSFKDLIEDQKICFFGNGSLKFNLLIHHSNASFAKIEATAAHMAVLSYERVLHKQFNDIAYSEPDYGKVFYSPAAKKSV